jgi:hypothetical protein
LCRTLLSGLLAHIALLTGLLLAHVALLLLARVALLTVLLLSVVGLLLTGLLLSVVGLLLLGSLIEFIQGLLLIFDGLRQVALFKVLGRFFSRLGRLGKLLLLGVTGQLLLQFGQVGLGVVVGLLLGVVVGLLLRVIGLLLGILGLVLGVISLLGLLRCLLGLFDGLLELLGGVVGVEALGLEGSLIISLFAAFLIELVLEVAGGLLEFIGGLLGLLRGLLRLVLLQILSGLLLILLGLLDGLSSLLQRLGGLRIGGLEVAFGHLLELFLGFIRRRLKLLLFLSQIAVLLGLLSLLSLFGNVSLVFREFFELVFQFFQSGNVLATLVDSLELMFQGFFGAFESLECLLLVGLGLAGVLGVEFILGLLHGLGGLLQGLLECGIGRQGSLLKLLGVLVGFFLEGLRKRESVRIFLGTLSDSLGVFLLLDEFVEALGCLFDGGTGIDFSLFRGGDTAVDFRFGLLEFVQGLLLGWLSLVEFTLTQGVFGFPLLVFDRFEQVGDFGVRVFGGFAGITGGEFGPGLCIGQFVAAHQVGVHTLTAGLLDLFRVRWLLGLLLDFFLGVNGALQFFLGGFQSCDRVGGRRPQGMGQVFKFLSMSTLTIRSQFPLSLPYQCDGALQFLEQAEAADSEFGPFQTVLLLR